MKIKVRGNLYELEKLTRENIEEMRYRMGLTRNQCPLCHDSKGNFMMRGFPTNINKPRVDQYKEEQEGKGVLMKCICLAGRPASDGDEDRKQIKLEKFGLGRITEEDLKELDLWQGREYKPRKRRSFS